jgi:hypothetical protein
LEQTVAYLSRLVLKARQYAESDPDVALGQARKSAEAICYRLFQNEIGSPGKMMLEELMTKLQARQVIPPQVLIPLRTIQMYGNFGVHAQDGHGEVSVEWVAPCLSALAQVTHWYFRDYLGIALPKELERAEGDIVSAPRNGGRETAPQVEISSSAALEQPPGHADPTSDVHHPQSPPPIASRWWLKVLAGGLLLLTLGGGYLVHAVLNDSERRQAQATTEATRSPQTVREAEVQTDQQQQQARLAETARAAEPVRSTQTEHEAKVQAGPQQQAQSAEKARATEPARTTEAVRSSQTVREAEIQTDQQQQAQSAEAAPASKPTHPTEAVRPVRAERKVEAQSEKSRKNPAKEGARQPKTTRAASGPTVDEPTDRTRPPAGRALLGIAAKRAEARQERRAAILGPGHRLPDRPP